MDKNLVNPAIILSRTWRFLTFRGLQIDIPNDLNVLLGAGLIFTWIAGIGRYWDHPNAELWQYLGLGSIAYIFVLAFIIWVLIYPIRKGPWSYKSVLTFIALTSPLAWLYAVPVERFLDVNTAITANVLFLIIVAFWRVGLLFQFLKSYGRFSNRVVLVIALLPLTLIIVALAWLNLEQAVFEVMAGIGDERSDVQQIHDGIYVWILMLSLASMALLPILGLVYFYLIYKARRERRKL